LQLGVTSFDLVLRVASSRVTHVAGRSTNQPKPATSGTSLVRQASTRNTEGPWHGLRRNLVESSPDDEQRVSEGVCSIVRVGPALQVALQGFVHHRGDGLETLAARVVGPHDTFLSGTG
jgi:hypothetical protein